MARAWRRTAADTALRFGARVERARGDRLVAYFGYPEAQEDAAQRAVRAGLAIAEAAPEGLAVKVGVHAGLVVMARGGDGDPEMFGEAPEVAARVQDGAHPGAVMITGAVHDVVSNVVATESSGVLQQAGTGALVRLYRAVSAGPAGRGFAPREPSPFVGRDDEARLLLGRWERVEEGEGQFVLAAGEPGIGKTRLVQEFKARLPDGAHRVIECAGAPLFASTPFHAVTQILRQGLGWRDADTPADRFAMLEAALARAGLEPAETVALIADLLGLPVPPAYARGASGCSRGWRPGSSPPPQRGHCYWWWKTCTGSTRRRWSCSRRSRSKAPLRGSCWCARRARSSRRRGQCDHITPGSSCPAWPHVRCARWWTASSRAPGWRTRWWMRWSGAPTAFRCSPRS